MNYLRIAKIAWFNPNVLNPNVHAQRIDEIDYTKLKEIGVKYLVFDKDNTLTAHLQNNYFDEDIKKCIENEVKQNYKVSNQVYIVSNSVKTQEKVDQIQNILGLDFILTKNKKPLNFSEIISHIRQKNPESHVKNHEIAFFGDRLFTDIYLANLNGAVSIYLDPFNNVNEDLGITIMRKLESFVFKRFGAKRSTNLFYLSQKIYNFEQLVKKQNQKGQ